jgi:hypothetical protein
MKAVFYAAAVGAILLPLGGCADIVASPDLSLNSCAMKETVAQGLPPYHPAASNAATCSDKAQDWDWMPHLF